MLPLKQFQYGHEQNHHTVKSIRQYDHEQKPPQSQLFHQSVSIVTNKSTTKSLNQSLHRRTNRPRPADYQIDRYLIVYAQSTALGHIRAKHNAKYSYHK